MNNVLTEYDDIKEKIKNLKTLFPTENKFNNNNINISSETLVCL